jgi:hypothetical protein
VGNKAFGGYDTMVAAIRSQIGRKPPGSAVTAVAASVLSSAPGQTQAIAANKAKLTDRRLILVVQGVVGSKPTGTWDVDTVRHIASFQGTAGLPADGKLDDKTLESVITALIAGNNQNAALHLIIGFYGLNRSHAFAVRYNPTFKPNTPGGVAEALQLPNGLGVGGVVHIGPAVFAMPVVNMIHNIAHELGHVEQVVSGIGNVTVREFLSRVIEIESKGIPELPIESAADIDAIYKGQQPAQKGLLVSANQAIHFWNQMKPDEKRTHLAQFRLARQIFLRRISQAAHLKAAQKSLVSDTWNSADAGL